MTIKYTKDLKESLIKCFSIGMSHAATAQYMMISVDDLCDLILDNDEARNDEAAAKGLYQLELAMSQHEIVKKAGAGAAAIIKEAKSAHEAEHENRYFEIRYVDVVKK